MNALAASDQQKAEDVLRMSVAVLGLRLTVVENELAESASMGKWSDLAGRAGQAETMRLAAAEMESLRATGGASKKSVLRLLDWFYEQDRLHTRTRDLAVKSGRFDDVAGCDGRGTGYVVAVKVLREELKGQGWV